MIYKLDPVWREFLKRELPIKNGEVDITFDQPKREWSARLNRPTVNIYLHDVRENVQMRQRQPAWEMQRNGNGTVTQRRRPVIVDLHYMITAWATEPEDEHRLLTRTLMVLFKEPNLPTDLLTDGFEEQATPIPIVVAQPEEMRNPAEVWSALDNELRPTVGCRLTVSLNPYEAFDGPLVRSRDLRLGPSGTPADKILDDPDNPDTYWAIGGQIASKTAFEEMTLTLVERGLEVPIEADGRYLINNLRAGEYTLEIAVTGKKPKRKKITVPAAEYDLKV